MKSIDLLEAAKEFTPVEYKEGFYWKREDLFSPFGIGGANGSKLRQLIHLIDRAKNNGAKGIIAGAVSNSPQHMMVAAVSKAFELPCTVVTGAREWKSYPMLELAYRYGAEIFSTNIGYAKAVQSKAEKMIESSHRGYALIETNITMEIDRNTQEDLRWFHSKGATQVMNVPTDVDTIILPCGSCNSAVSVLFGMFMRGMQIKNIILMGIGSYGSKGTDYLWGRLGFIDPRIIDYFSSENFNIEYHNLNGTGYCKYEDTMPFNFAGIEFHPRYEGKIMNYMDEKKILDHKTHKRPLFWIVGSEPKF